jgi:hypothetical protein
MKTNGDLMNYKIEITNPLSQPEWNEIIKQSDLASPFLTSNWAKVLNETYDYKPFYFLIKETKDNTLAGIIPFLQVDSFLTGKRGVSLPFTDYCPPLFFKKISFNSIFSLIKDFAVESGWQYVEFRDGEELFKEDPSEKYYIHAMELTSDIDQLHKNVKSNTKRNIKKAENSGVEIKIGNSEEDVETYYNLHCLTRQRHGVPPQPHSFFKNIYTNMIKEGMGNVISASYKGEVISSCIYFYFGKKVIYKFGASDLKHQDVRANNLLMWKAISYFAEQGYTYFSFGKTDIENEGLRKYKLGYGAQERVLTYFRYNLNDEKFSLNNSRFASMEKVFNLMPVPILKMIGNVMYRHMG